MDRGDIVVRFVRDYTSKHGYSPSYREIAEAAGVSSTSHISYWIRKEVDRGRLTRVFNRPRSIRAVDND
jgi:repressor LexA